MRSCAGAQDDMTKLDREISELHPYRDGSIEVERTTAFIRVIDAALDWRLDGTLTER
jgi:hypothetical protein